MNKNLRNILKELGLSNRIEILRFLSCHPANLVQIQRHLASVGCKMSVGGLARCLNALIGLDLVEKFGDGCYSVTGLGLLMLDIILKLDKIFKYKDELVDALELMEALPSELKIGLANLSKAKVEHDIYIAVKKAIEEVSRAEKWGKYVCRIMECNVFKMLIRNYLRGVKDKMISSSDTLNDRIEMIIQSIKSEGLSEDEINKIKDNLEIRVLDLPFQLGIIDGRIAFFQILKPERTSPAFISTDKEFVDWANRMFDYFWNIAKPVRIPFEKALEPVK